MVRISSRHYVQSCKSGFFLVPENVSEAGTNCVQIHRRQQADFIHFRHSNVVPVSLKACQARVRDNTFNVPPS